MSDISKDNKINEVEHTIQHEGVVDVDVVKLSFFQSMMLSPVAGLIIIAVANAFFAMKGIFAKFIYQDNIAPDTLLFLRMALSIPVFILPLVQYFYVHRRRQKEAQDELDDKWVMLALLAGVIGFLPTSYLDFLGLQYVPASIERVILFTSPAFILIYTTIKTRSINKIAFLSLAITYIGVVVTMNPDLIFPSWNASSDAPSVRSMMDNAHQNIPLGVTLVLLAAFGQAMYLLMGTHVMKNIAPPTYTSFAMTGACIAMTIVYIISNLIHNTTIFDVVSSIKLQTWYYIIGLTIFSTIIPVYLIAFGIKIMGATKSAIIGNVGVVLTAIYGVLILDEQITASLIIGTILIMFGIFVITSNKNS